MGSIGLFGALALFFLFLLFIGICVAVVDVVAIALASLFRKIFRKKKPQDEQKNKKTSYLN